LLLNTGSITIYHRVGGVWGAAYIVTLPHYMDRNGDLFTPEECRVEWEEYKKTSNIYDGDL
jgi:hypothetical protein